MRRPLLKRVARAHRGWVALPGNVRGGIWTTASALIAAVNAAMIKDLAANLPPIEIVFFRMAFGMLVILPFALRSGTGSLKTGRYGAHLLRAACSTAGMVCAFLALKYMPLADAIALQFTKPLFQIVLAVLILAEVVRWRRWTATVVGFVGAIVILQPGSHQFSPAYLLPLATAAFYAATQIFIKQLSRTERPNTITLYFSVLGVPLTIVPAIWFWVWPDPGEWLMLVALAATATLGQTCSILGIRAGDVTAVGTFEYTQLIWAGLLGYFVFGELPGVWSWVGAGIVVASAVYMARREAQIARAERTAARFGKDPLPR